ncbi:MAG TPA: hypothetical protein VJI67_00335, partial [archaeon]|nr:hypothetical protein [archaeon]
MIISKTPFRVSFFGGGTDLPDVYRKIGGAVLSTTVNKYMYITVHKAFDNKTTVKYAKTENVDSLDKLEHPIVREAMNMLEIPGGLEISSVADIPAQTGLGSSSSFTVGLLNALHAYKGEFCSAEQLGREAVRIEMELLKEPCGKQDQYAAAYGGFNYIRFNTDETVSVDPVICKPETRKKLQENLLFFYTGAQRPSSKILSEQKKKTIDKMDYLKNMIKIAEDGAARINNNDLSLFGEMLHKNWEMKKQLASTISDPFIDESYEKAMKAGAT